MLSERKLVLSKTFEKSYQKYTKNNPALKQSISKTLIKLQHDAYDPSLRTHKLSGKLVAYLACSCGYDCRIIFTIEKDIVDTQLENVVLLDIGTHNDVY
ncbi:type II toxin-antitoxin system RelE/ParE family toxin [Mucilaginibacter sp. UYCu711]|uniref:type II toxin-antitoxin system RelE/ParE family toxin n=1 Tax=Mucilaginibacter sp. UYCu711 TaxID=3156339 RepID=UPI003D19B2CF